MPLKLAMLNLQIHCHRLPLWKKDSLEVKAATELKQWWAKSQGTWTAQYRWALLFQMALLNTFIHETLQRQSFHPDCVVTCVCIIQGFVCFCFVTVFGMAIYFRIFTYIYTHITVSYCFFGFFFFFYIYFLKAVRLFFLYNIWKSCPFFIYIIFKLLFSVFEVCLIWTALLNCWGVGSTS